jgi:hypothetical protein
MAKNVTDIVAIITAKILPFSGIARLINIRHPSIRQRI